MALACDTVDLVQDAKCLMCFSETELLAAEALLREQLFADSIGDDVRSSDELLLASVAWTTLSQHARDAIEVRQLCEDAVTEGARESCDAADLKEDTKCYCSLSKSQLESIISYLKCQARQ